LALRGNNVRWLNGIVPYQFEPGYSMYYPKFHCHHRYMINSNNKNKNFVLLKLSSNKSIYLIASDQQAAIVTRMRKLENLVAINNVRCIQFRPKVPEDSYYIKILNDAGCFATVCEMDHSNLLSIILILFFFSLDKV
jgi:hypothetical protein